mmetsp:Transcript_3177/g.10523  ORF Transcript_3177/g.10523 Transcript_3177/m.10523 type:complete len:214 (-) Transcript_3177:417-1058(-)
MRLEEASCRRSTSTVTTASSTPGSRLACRPRRASPSMRRGAKSSSRRATASPRRRRASSARRGQSLAWWRRGFVRPRSNGSGPDTARRTKTERASTKTPERASPERASTKTERVSSSPRTATDSRWSECPGRARRQTRIHSGSSPPSRRRFSVRSPHSLSSIPRRSSLWSIGRPSRPSGMSTKVISTSSPSTRSPTRVATTTTTRRLHHPRRH